MEHNVAHIASWKIDTPFENWLSHKADNNEMWKKIYVLFYRIFDAEYYKKGLKLLDKNIEKFWGGYSLSKREHDDLQIDMIYSLHRFGCMFDEYFLFDFRHLNSKGRETFVTDKNRWAIYGAYNKDENYALFLDKNKTYELYRDFYGRECVLIAGSEDYEKFSAFIDRHCSVIVKPYNQSGGRGIFILRKDDYATVEDAFTKAIENGSVFIEELIRSDSELQSFHEGSLNTLRVPTIYKDGEVTVWRPFARFGRGDAVVDNAASGGLICLVDEKSGVIYSARDESGNEYLYHPDSKKQLVGYRIPRWNEAKDLVIKLANVLPDNRYTGWDIALTPNGWVMVEGNASGQIIQQIVLKCGLKRELELML